MNLTPFTKKWVGLAVVAVLAIAACSGSARHEVAADPVGTAQIIIEPNNTGSAVNRKILGNNIQWVDNGDGLIDAQSGEFTTPSLIHARQMGTTVLRYPGGAQSDLYHWQDGMGALAARGSNAHFFTGTMQQVRFGTQEFLEYCEALGAQPLITVNTATGSPEEAAAWVRQVNETRLRSKLTGELLPKVVYWEIGNEPYVDDPQHPELWIEPEDFAARASTYIKAMKQVDPSIQVGIPLRSDTIGQVQAVTHQGYNRTVLSAMDAPFEFVALHNAYLPFNYDPGTHYSKQDYFLAGMAAYRVVAADFHQTRVLLNELLPGKPIPLAVTEYNALYQLSQSAESAYISSLGGTMVVADLLQSWATIPDLLLANIWSLSGNGYFGTMNENGQPRPAYHGLKLFNELLQGQLIESEVISPTFSSPAVGVVPAYEQTPIVTALATRDNDVIRLLVLNKSWSQALVTTVTMVSGPQPVHIRWVSLTADDPLDSGLGEAVIDERSEELHTTLPLSFSLQAHSIVLMTIGLTN